jgi:peptidoglycan recognition protein
VKVISRKAWGAKPPRSARQKMTLPALGTYIHHTVTASKPGAPQERAHMRYLQEIAFGRGFADISYSFVIFPSGRVYRGRGWGVVGAHTEGSNSTTHAFSFVGNFESDRPTKDALEAAAALHRRGITLGHIKPTGFIKGHRDAPGAATACPGKNLYAQVDRIKQLSR